jgi:uncharacterized protein
MVSDDALGEQATYEHEITSAVRDGYGFAGEALELGGLMLDARTIVAAPVRIPLAMLNRHGLVAGAKGTGKTKPPQLLAEQLSAAGVPVFSADVKGDLSGLAMPGERTPAARPPRPARGREVPGL